jgi:hypothetical protein
MRRRAFPFLRVGSALICLLVTGVGCSRAPVEDTPIAADDTTEFFRWKRDIAGRLTPERQRQLESALEELRLDIMFRQEASGHDAIESAVCRKLNHLPLKEALLLGLQVKWKRLAGEQADLQRVLNANAHLITKPGDHAAADDLESYRAKQQKRFDTVAADRQSVEREIKALGGKVAALEAPAPIQAPLNVSHEEALKQIDEMLTGRLNAATIRLGAWPIKIDWEGAQLEGEKRAEFLAKKSANGRGERVIIPLRIKGHWLLYEGADQAPKLPDDVIAALSPAEATAFKRRWIEAEAELWARQLAKEFPEPPAAAEPEPDAPAKPRRT